MKRNYSILIGIFLILLASCSGRVENGKERQTVKIDTVAFADEPNNLQFPGKVKAAQDVSLSFRVSGSIDRIHAKEGTRVRQGQLLAELDATDYQVQLDATEAEYRQVKAEAERVMALYQENGTTPNANDKAVYGLKQITAKYKHHRDQVAYTRLYAPFDGYVQKHLFEAHETVGAGMPVLSMVSAGTPEVEIHLPAAEYIRRDSFDRYSCTFDIYPGKSYPLQAVSISPKANANQLYSMRLRLVPDGGEIPAPGMNTMVTIRCRTGAAELLSVPTAALREKDGKTCVFVFRPSDSTVHAREVRPVRLSGNGRSLVTAEGVEVGELVVSSGVHQIENGETVKPLPPVTKTNVGGLL